MNPISNPYDEVGKRLHIREAIKWQMNRFKIENKNIILIDDSEKNIEVAEKMAIKAFLFHIALVKQSQSSQMKSCLYIATA